MIVYPREQRLSQMLCIVAEIGRYNSDTGSKTNRYDSGTIKNRVISEHNGLYSSQVNGGKKESIKSCSDTVVEGQCDTVGEAGLIDISIARTTEYTTTTKHRSKRGQIYGE